MSYVRCSAEVHKLLKIEAAKRGATIQDLLDSAVHKFFSEDKTNAVVVAMPEGSMSVPRNLREVVQFIIALFAEQSGSQYEESLKNALRLDAARHAAQIKREHRKGTTGS